MISKLLLAAAMWFARPASCRLCGEPVRNALIATNFQFVILVGAFILIPWFLPAGQRVLAAYSVGSLMLVVGLLAPTRKVMTV